MRNLSSSYIYDHTYTVFTITRNQIYNLSCHPKALVFIGKGHRYNVISLTIQTIDELKTVVGINDPLKAGV